MSLGGSGPAGSPPPGAGYGAARGATDCDEVGGDEVLYVSSVDMSAADVLGAPVSLSVATMTGPGPMPDNVDMITSGVKGIAGGLDELVERITGLPAVTMSGDPVLPLGEGVTPFIVKFAHANTVPFEVNMTKLRLPTNAGVPILVER